MRGTVANTQMKVSKIKLIAVAVFVTPRQRVLKNILKHEYFRVTNLVGRRQPVGL